MDTSCCQANRELTAEEKLRMVLNYLCDDGNKMRRSAQDLADKVAGPIPSSSCNEVPSPFPGDLNQLADAITRELNYIFAETGGALMRAHERLGTFDMGVKGECPPPPPARLGDVRGGMGGSIHR